MTQLSLKIANIERYIHSERSKIIDFLSIYNCCNYIRNIVCNDYIIEHLSKQTRYIAIEDFMIKLIKYKESPQIRNFIGIAKIVEPKSNYSIANLFIFCASLQRMAESALRLSSHNHTCPDDNLEKSLRVIYENNIFPDCEEYYLSGHPGTYRGLESNFFTEETRIMIDDEFEPVEINSFDKSGIVMFDTAINTYNANKRCLGLMNKPDLISEKIKNELKKIAHNSYEYTTLTVEQELISNCSSFLESCDDFTPYIKISGTYYTNATLMSRFISSFINTSCEKNKRFQIKSRYI